MNASDVLRIVDSAGETLTTITREDLIDSLLAWEWEAPEPTRQRLHGPLAALGLVDPARGIFGPV